MVEFFKSCIGKKLDKTKKSKNEKMKFTIKKKKNFFMCYRMNMYIYLQIMQIVMVKKMF